MPPEEPMIEGQNTHDSDGESPTHTKPKSQHILDDWRTKRCMYFDVGSSTRNTLVVQLNRLVNVVPLVFKNHDI